MNQPINTANLQKALTGKTVTSCNFTDGDHVKVITINDGKNYIQIVINDHPELNVELSTVKI